MSLSRLVQMWKGAFKLMRMVVIFAVLWVVLTPLFRLNRTVQGDLFRNLPENTLDVVAVGSSHMQYAFNPGVFYNETGYYAYVMGSACQPFSESYYMLKEVFQTQNPSVALIDVFTLMSQSQICYADGMHYLAIDEMSGQNRFDAASDAPMDEETVRSYQFDLLMNHDNWKNMDLSDLDSIIENAKPAEGYNPELGYVRQEPVEVKATPVWQYEVTESLSLTDEQKQWIDRIIDLCKEENVTPIFVKTPYSIDQDNFNQLDAIFTYVQSKGVETINYLTKANEIGWYTDMHGDDWHNNSWGSEVITKDLSKYILENSLVQNHVDDETWDTLISDMNYSNALSFFDYRNIDVYRLLEDAPNYPVITVLRYFGNDHTSIGEAENALLQNCGFTKDFTNNPEGNYYAVVKNGEILQESTEPFELTVGDMHIQITDEHIYVNESYYDESIGEMDLLFFREDGAVYNWISIDYASRWFWKNGYTGFTAE